MRRGPTGVERAGGGAARTRRGRWRRQAGRKRGHRRRCCAALRTAAMAVMASVRPCRSTEGVRSGGGRGGGGVGVVRGHGVHAGGKLG